jgi:hypothetical protein
VTALGEIWRKRLWFWLPALVFFLANAAVFSVYRWGYAGQVQRLEEVLEERGKELQQIQQTRQKREGLYQRAQINEQRLADFYDERLATRRQRLTQVSGEVKSMAAKAGMVPKAITYPEADIEEFKLIKRSFVFSVEGTYAGLRRFINLLELSDSFLTLEEVTLTEGGQGPELRMNLKISTLFAKDADEPALHPADAARARKGAQ